MIPGISFRLCPNLLPGAALVHKSPSAVIRQRHETCFDRWIMHIGTDSEEKDGHTFRRQYLKNDLD